VTQTQERFPSACVASPHRLATEAGVEMLRAGGNAVDAAVAVNVTLAVVAPSSCGLGGDLFLLMWRDGEVHAYNGSGRAPAAATPDAVRRAAEGATGPRDLGGLPERGALTVTVPGAVEAWFRILERFGTRSFADCAAAGARFAADGFAPSAKGATSFHEAAAALPRDDPAFAEWHTVYDAAREGEPFRQPGIARTLAALGSEGPDAYYRGEFGAALVETVRSHGGLLAAEDLASHTGDWVRPLSVDYRGHEVLELPPNTQGVVALEALAMLRDAGELPADGDARHHRLLEATKLALSDRRHVTDPDAMRIAVADLLDEERLRALASTIHPEHAGRPPGAFAAPGGTAHMAAVDASGMCVSLIQSNWEGFGSGVTVPGWGVNLHNRGSRFFLDPAYANVIAPRKRPMHTLIPAMALRDGRPRYVFGTMGGDGQAQIHVQLLAHLVDDEWEPQRAVDAPRWELDLGDWSVAAERRFDPGTIDGLRRRGHEVTMTAAFDPSMGHANVIQVDADGLAGAADPRSEGAALGF
jgi:gamma-glutamyltranspeptidase/glutathione hydrolase